MTPKMFRSHNTTPITTTAFKMDLIDPAIGMKLLTSHNKTPTMIRTQAAKQNIPWIWFSCFPHNNILEEAPIDICSLRNTSCVCLRIRG
jgi:hypothetical protein